MEDNRKNKIMIATIECIEKYGIENTTIRKIAEFAGLNSAAISYYFSSKEQLIDSVFKWNVQDVFSWKDFEQFSDLPAKGQLIEILTHLCSGGVKYPNIVRAHFYPIFTEGNNNIYAVQELNSFMEKLFLLLKKSESIDLNDENLKKAITFICSSTFIYLTLFNNLLKQFNGKDMTEYDEIKIYITYIVNTCLPSTM